MTIPTVDETLHCPGCGQLVYTASYWSDKDQQPFEFHAEILTPQNLFSRAKDGKLRMEPEAASKWAHRCKAANVEEEKDSPWRPKK